MSQGCKDSVNELKPTREDKKLMNWNVEQAKDNKRTKIGQPKWVITTLPVQEGTCRIMKS